MHSFDERAPPSPSGDHSTRPTPSPLPPQQPTQAFADFPDLSAMEPPIETSLRDGPQSADIVLKNISDIAALFPITNHLCHGGDLPTTAPNCMTQIKEAFSEDMLSFHSNFEAHVLPPNHPEFGRDPGRLSLSPDALRFTSSSLLSAWESTSPIITNQSIGMNWNHYNEEGTSSFSPNLQFPGGIQSIMNPDHLPFSKGDWITMRLQSIQKYLSQKLLEQRQLEFRSASSSLFNLIYTTICIQDRPLIEPFRPDGGTAWAFLVAMFGSHSALYTQSIYDKLANSTDRHRLVIMITAVLTTSPGYAHLDFKSLKDGFESLRPLGNSQQRLITLLPPLNAPRLQEICWKHVRGTCNTSSCGRVHIGPAGRDRFFKMDPIIAAKVNARLKKGGQRSRKRPHEPVWSCRKKGLAMTRHYDNRPVHRAFTMSDDLPLLLVQEPQLHLVDTTPASSQAPISALDDTVASFDPNLLPIALREFAPILNAFLFNSSIQHVSHDPLERVFVVTDTLPLNITATQISVWESR